MTKIFKKLKISFNLDLKLDDSYHDYSKIPSESEDNKDLEEIKDNKSIITRSDDSQEDIDEFSYQTMINSIVEYSNNYLFKKTRKCIEVMNIDQS